MVGFEQEYWVTDRDGIPLGWQLDKDFCHDSKISYFIIANNLPYCETLKGFDQ